MSSTYHVHVNFCVSVGTFLCLVVCTMFGCAIYVHVWLGLCVCVSPAGCAHAFVCLCVHVFVCMCFAFVRSAVCERVCAFLLCACVYLCVCMRARGCVRLGMCVCARA